MQATSRWNSPASEEGGRSRQSPLQRHKEQRRKAASGNLVHTQWLCPHWFCLNPCKPDLLMTVCNHLMTACPTTGQGSHQATQRSGSALPDSEHPYTVMLVSGMEKQEEAGIKCKPRRRLRCCPCRKRTPCSANPVLYWRVGLEGSGASPRSTPGLAEHGRRSPCCRAAVPVALAVALHPQHKATCSNWLGLTSPATAQPR